jgi:hypothetical protein
MSAQGDGGFMWNLYNAVTTLCVLGTKRGMGVVIGPNAARVR